MKEIRIGLIGTGIIAHSHISDYMDLPNIKVAAACDINADKLDTFCTKYNIENKFANFRDMLKHGELDAVDVCLHNNFHAPVSIEIMRAGLDCYCEKPMAGSYSDALAMSKVSEETGKKLHIQLAFLYSEQTHAAKKLIKNGLLGEIYHARSYGYRRRGRPFVDGFAEKEFNSKYWASGGALYDMGVYHISVLLYLLGLPKVERISGAIYQELDMHEQRRIESGFNVEELGAGFVKFANGLTMDILESWAIHAKAFPPSSLAGSKGGLSFGSELEYYSEIEGYPAITKFDLGAETYRTHQIDPSLSMYDNSLAHWIGALRGDCELINTKDIALQTMLISEGIFQSSERGREVTVDEIIETSKHTYITEQETPFGTLKYTL